MKFTLYLTLLISVPIYAQVLGLEKLTNMSIEDLMKVKVSVASKQNVKPEDAPGFISVYTQKEIKALGYYTLAELANITPGFTSMYKFAGKQSFTVRGQRVPGNNFDNNKVLVLVDGIPMNHLRNGRAPMNEEMALDGVERVEFLKGPASALYGTNAFFGVINIVMNKRKTEGVDVEGRWTYGQYGTIQNNISTRFKNKMMSGQASATYSKKDSMGLPWGDNSSNFRRSIDHLEAMTLNTSLTFNEGILRYFTFGLIHNGIKSGTWDNFGDPSLPTEADTGSYNFATTTGYLKYKKQISENVIFKTYFRRARSTEESRSYRYRQNFSATEVLAEAHYLMKKDSRMIFGLDYDQRKREGSNKGTYQNIENPAQDAYVKSPSNPLRTYSAYYQYNTELPIGKGLLTTLGVRYDHATAHEGPIEVDVQQVSPRLAFVQKLDNSFSLKLLYGRALRSPDLKAIGLANEAVTAVPNSQLPDGFDVLTAEKISSYELGLTYTQKNLSTTLASFYTVASDLMGRETADLTPSDPSNGIQDIYKNKNGDSIGYGLEYEIKYSFKNRDILSANVAWNMASLPENDIDKKGEYGGIPAYTTSVSYFKDWGRFSGSVVGYYIGPRHTNSGVNHPQNGFLLMDANIAYKINPYADFTLWVRNLGDRDFRYSATGTQDTLAERGYARSVYGTLSFSL